MEKENKKVGRKSKFDEEQKKSLNELYNSQYFSKVVDITKKYCCKQTLVKSAKEGAFLAEIENLKEENQNLKVENQNLKVENQQLDNANRRLVVENTVLKMVNKRSALSYNPELLSKKNEN